MALSPVSGIVRDTYTVDAPPKPYAAAHDHLIVINLDTAGRNDNQKYDIKDGSGSSGSGEPSVARLLHIDPSVEPGERVAVGDPLGTLVCSGFFAPWVDNHIHLGFRDASTDPRRASGSLPLALDPALDVRPLAWDGTGRVVETGETYVLLDSPDHPTPGEQFAGIATDDGNVLDGGLRHYTGGGILGDVDRSKSGSCPESDSAPVSLLGAEVGVATGRTVTWTDVGIRANGAQVTGLSLFLAREECRAKLICPGQEFTLGEQIEVTITQGDEPIVLSDGSTSP